MAASDSVDGRSPGVEANSCYGAKMGSDDRVTVLRPSLHNVLINYAAGVRIGKVNVTIGVAALAAAVVTRQVPFWVPAILLVIFGSGLALALVYVKSVAILIDHDSVVIRHGRLLGNRVLRRSAVGRISLVEVRQTPILPRSVGGIPTFKALFLDKTDHVIHRLSGWAWSPESLGTVAREIGVPADSAWRVVTARDIRREKAGSVGWIEALGTWSKIVFLLIIAVVTISVINAIHG